MVFDRIVLYCDDKNLSIPAFEKKCGLANGLVMKWRKNNYEPSVSTLQKIVSATGIPIEEWLKPVDPKEWIKQEPN